MPLSVPEIRDRLRGVAAGLLTPFTEDQSIDYEGIQYNATELHERGIRTFLAAANISEYHSLSHDERISVVETSVGAVPESACVLAGVGGSTPYAKELIRAYDRIDVDAMMIMPPDHTYIHERGLLEYYRELSAASESPLVPYVRGFDPSVDYLDRLTRIDGVIGIKYALEDPIKLGTAVATGADDVVWMDGLAEPFAVSFWAEGAEGFSAGVSNFYPEIGLKLYESLAAGDWERARELRDICMPYQKFRSESGDGNSVPGAVSVPSVKKGLELSGLVGGSVREPIRPLSTDMETKAEELYAQLEENAEEIL